ncbi:SDR family NAD(P)-dependent oxidoreductase, partial [Streptomyces goshikiensis]
MQGKTALVTGAAGGIGEAVVRALASRGVRVAAVDLNADRLREAAKAAVEDGLDVTAFPADVTLSTEVDEVVAEVESALGPIDYLVNAAGVLRMGPARSLSDEEWAVTFAVNTTGVFFMSRAVVNRMVARESGA